MEEQYFSVTFDAAGPPVAEEEIDRLIEVLDILEVEGAAVSAGGGVNGLSVTFSIEAASLDEAVVRGADRFRTAIEKAAIPIYDVERIHATTEAAQTVDLNRGPERYVGVAEIAEILGVSKQRVYELRDKPEFPKPLAQLASGPVWAHSMLQRFISEWPRRRTGRPRKEPETTTMQDAMDALKGALDAEKPKKQKVRKVS